MRCHNLQAQSHLEADMTPALGDVTMSCLYHASSQLGAGYTAQEFAGQVVAGLW